MHEMRWEIFVVVVKSEQWVGWDGMGWKRWDNYLTRFKKNKSEKIDWRLRKINEKKREREREMKSPPP